ncbi:hypothetical protein GCM10008018_17510 [Paenibacillus marchantiophytorum]|uniref:Pectinesterase n=1 Tax=Paenibacillus marchantiophytorum TaxID=1619310 RepID=A0ABQ2BSF1_9BACL|nr:pectinesterase family protein [Paenibacillus marchantiophytorum]GGI46521.1 hypothetical protein GCM10008018_17510 [Paenibacillus marchantiophytorum]
MITVAADGSGDYISIQEAINHIPEERSEPTIIIIKSGIYKEKLEIYKSHIHLIGESAETTIITYDDYANKTFPNGEPYHTFHSYTVFIGGDDISVKRLTFENTAGSGEVVGQALAAYVDGDRISFQDCKFLGHQDTLFTGPLPPKPRERASFGGPREGFPIRPVRQYYERCYIEGDIDFIFGSATAVFQDCEISSSGGGWITAASTPEKVEFGYVFIRCKLTGEAAEQSVALGRPWRNYAKVAFIDCWLGSHIKVEGWDRWGEREPIDELAFIEYGSIGPGADNHGRAAWSKVIARKEADRFAAQNILAGHDGWNPVSDEQPITLYLAGDSTMSSYAPSYYPRLGWGQVLGWFFDHNVVVSNDAASGRSSKSFIDEGRLAAILNRIREDDYLLIQFGHNDQKPDEERHTDPQTSYLDHLRQYVEGARAKGATPVLITSVQRRSFDEQGTFTDTHGDYPTAVKQLAEEYDVAIIDLAAKSKELFMTWGGEQTKTLFLWLTPGENANYPEGVQDDTHFSAEGAWEIAKLVIQGINEQGLPIARLIRR